MYSKGQFSGRTGFIVLSILFMVTVSAIATVFNVEGINCQDPSDTISQPSENATTVDRVIGPANDVVGVFFGCDSQDAILNGFFTALKAGIIIVLLFVAKDLVPFT